MIAVNKKEISVMGMSAGQARLLSVTARLTDNELRSQMLTNTKLRLADKSSAASNEYMDALNTQQLMYTSYDGSGNKQSTALTANTIFTFADLKNQYAMVNSSGQILVLGSDIKNFESSTSMADFMYAYGIEKTENPEYVSSLTYIFGDDYEKFFDYANPNKYTQDKNGNALSYVTTLSSFTDVDIANISAGDYNNLKTQYLNSLTNAGLVVNSANSGIFKNYVNILNEIPEYVEKAEKPELLDYAQELLRPQCWKATGIDDLRTSTGSTSNEEIWHMEHVLSQYLWSTDSSASNYSDGGTITVQTENGTETMTNVDKDTGIYNSGTFSLSSGGGNGKDPMDVRGVLAQPENAVLKEELEQLYYQIALHISKNNTNGGLTSGSITNVNNNQLWTNEQIGERYLELINELLVAVAEDILNSGPSDDRYEELGTYNDDLEKYNDYVEFQAEFTQWVSSANKAVKEFEKYIDEIPVKDIPDETDSKYQWYKNLWYRMGGITDTKKEENSNKYKELDPTLLNSSEWLQFALEHGVITLEQASYNENGSSKYPNMGSYDWTSIIYTNASDIVSVEDSAAIAKAEVEYENAIREIENEDKKIDQDLKKLDTEHTALQTEYESIKSVIDKNVERSFKAFS